MNKLDSKKKRQFISSLIAMLGNGILALSIGTLLPFVSDSYALDYGFAGLLVSLHSFGNLISSFVAGILPIYIGKRNTILMFASCELVFGFLLATSGNKAILILAFILSGLARGAASNFNNATVNDVAPGQAWALNTLHAFFAIGAFATPFLVLFCVSNNTDNWKWMCYVIMAMSLIQLIVYALIPININKPESSQKQGGNLDFIKNKQFIVCVGILFFYLCAEQGVIGWLVTYFKDSGLLSTSYAQMMSSVLWILILVGRLVAAYLSQKMDTSKLLVFMGTGFVFFFIVLLLGRSLPMITLGIAGFGFSMAGIYPTTISFASPMFKQYPLAWSTLLTTASVGAIVMPIIIGAVASSAGIVAGMISVVVVVLITFIFIVLNRKIST